MKTDTLTGLRVCRCPPDEVWRETGLLLHAPILTAVILSAFRSNVPAAVASVQVAAVILERYGKRAAVLISPERYDELMDALEEISDLEAFDADMAVTSPSIPWDQVQDNF